MATAKFQSQVQKTPAKGVPGDKASLNPVIYTDKNYLSGDSSVTVGRFAWGNAEGRALSTGAGLPLGIVERTLTFVNMDCASGGTLTLPEHSALNIVVRGDLYVEAATAATRGHKVFAVLADGSLKTAAAGATVTGAVETPWSVTEGGAAGDIITISNWSA